MSNRTIKVTQKVFARVGMCLLGTAALMLPAGNSLLMRSLASIRIIRGIPSSSGFERAAACLSGKLSERLPRALRRQAERSARWCRAIR